MPVGADDDPRRVGDEPLLLARAGYPVVVANDRVAAGRALLARNPECDVILSDDGLQHYRLARSVEIAVVDAVRGLGNRCSLPAGPLREPASRLGEVDAVVVLSAASDAAPPIYPGTFAMRLAGDRFVRVDDPLTSAPASAFARSDVHALAGIGHPERFFAQLAAMGIVATPHPFRDHHRFVAADLDDRRRAGDPDDGEGRAKMRGVRRRAVLVSARPRLRRRCASSPWSKENSVDPKLLDILVCPVTKGPLVYDKEKQELISKSARLAYPIRDGIPVMLEDEARRLEPSEYE